MKRNWKQLQVRKTNIKKNLQEIFQEMVPAQLDKKF